MKVKVGDRVRTKNGIGVVRKTFHQANIIRELNKEDRIVELKDEENFPSIEYDPQLPDPQDFSGPIIKVIIHSSEDILEILEK